MEYEEEQEFKRVYRELNSLKERVCCLSKNTTGDVLTKKVHVTSAEILQLNTSPKELIPAPGVGKFIQILGVTEMFNFISIGYPPIPTPGIYYNVSDGSPIAVINLGQAENKLETIPIISGIMRSNTGLTIFSSGGNPTAGDGTLDIYITYKIIDL